MIEKMVNPEFGLISEFEKKFGFHITPKQFHLLFPNLSSYKSAHRKYTRIKDSLGKESHQMLTIIDVANFEGIPVEKIYLILYYPQISTRINKNAIP